MAPYIERHSALLLGNHGTVTMGDSVLDSYYRLEALEQYAKILFITTLMGGAGRLPRKKPKPSLTTSGKAA